MPTSECETKQTLYRPAPIIGTYSIAWSTYVRIKHETKTNVIVISCGFDAMNTSAYSGTFS